MRAVALHLQARPERWHPSARCWVETAPARGKDMGSHPLWVGRTTVASLEYMRPAGPWALVKTVEGFHTKSRLPKMSLTICLIAWYENVAHAWSSGSCWKGRGPLQYTCRSSRSLSNMSSQLAVSEQSNSLNRWWLHMYSLWRLNPRPMAHKTIALTTELRELLTIS